MSVTRYKQQRTVSAAGCFESSCSLHCMVTTPWDAAHLHHHPFCTADVLNHIARIALMAAFADYKDTK